MRCPYCHVDDKDRVIDSRPVEDGQAIRRRRVCEKCTRRYTTYERIEETVR
ncbi:MAG: transcriptional regulator NrdR, partial [Phycisphaerae bacterium]